LNKVAVTAADPKLFGMNGFKTPTGTAAHAIYSERVDVSVYPIQSVASGG
jgi:hypothetical protein